MLWAYFSLLIHDFIVLSLALISNESSEFTGLETSMEKIVSQKKESSMGNWCRLLYNGIKYNQSIDYQFSLIFNLH